MSSIVFRDISYLSQSLADIQIQFQYLSPCSPLIYFKITRENDESKRNFTKKNDYKKAHLFFLCFYQCIEKKKRKPLWRDVNSVHATVNWKNPNCQIDIDIDERKH